MNAPDLGDLGSFPTQGAPCQFRKGPPRGSTNPRRRNNAPDLVTGGRAAPSAQHAVVAPRIKKSTPLVELLQGPEFLRTSAGIVVVVAGAPGADPGLSSSLLLPWGPVLAQASLLALYFHQCNTFGCSLLRCGSRRKPGSRRRSRRCGSSSTGPPVNHADSGKTILKHFRRG